MKNSSPLLFILLFTLVTLNSCGVVETIFKAGMWWAFFLVGLVVFIVAWIAMKARKK
jgi:hypothetical protein